MNTNNETTSVLPSFLRTRPEATSDKVWDKSQKRFKKFLNTVIPNALVKDL